MKLFNIIMPSTSWLSLLLVVDQVQSINLYNPKSGTHKIVGSRSGTGTQHLPISYVQSFPRWHVVTSPINGNLQIQQVTSQEQDVARKLSQLLKSDDNDDDDDDDNDNDNDNDKSKPILIRPSLQILIKGGIPSYVLASVELKKENESTTYSPIAWTAQQWITFANAVEPNFRIFLFTGGADGTDEVMAHVNAQAVRIEAMERLGAVLQLEQAQDFVTGFHVLHMPLETEAWIPVSDLVDHDGIKEQEFPWITCLATAEPDPREVLTLDPEVAEMTVSSILQIPLYLQQRMAKTFDSEL